jgi:arsenate reductase
MSDSPIRVLFVCTGNSARSQMAEALLRREGGQAFEVFSAGTEPRGVHPLAIRALADVGIDITGARSKSVDEFRDQPFDYVITLCDRARATCPVFPGAHETMHWGFDDPAEATGTEAERLAVFARVLGEIAGRLRLFIPIALRGEHASVPSA